MKHVILHLHILNFSLKDLQTQRKTFMEQNYRKTN